MNESSKHPDNILHYFPAFDEPILNFFLFSFNFSIFFFFSIDRLRFFFWYQVIIC